ncbi:MAG: dihydrodipicolinate synthase family protein [Lentisphaeria bacterium]
MLPPAFPRTDGLIAATFTPMHPDGRLKLAVIPAYAARLAERGVQKVFVCGTTGEGTSLTTTERQRVAAAWQAAGRLPVIVHVGHTCLADAKALAAHAQEIGAAGVAAMAPFFFKPATVQDLAGFCQGIAAAAPRLPFYYYHIPSMTGVQLPVAEFLRVAGPLIPNLAGVKFTFEDLSDLQECLAVAAGRFEILFGRDEILLAGLALGCRGAVGSTYNFAAPLYRRVIAGFQAGDLAGARAAQLQAAAAIRIICRRNGLAAQKALLKRLEGIDCGPVRLPLATLPETAAAAMEQDLRTAGLWDALAAGTPSVRRYAGKTRKEVKTPRSARSGRRAA